MVNTWKCSTFTFTLTLLKIKTKKQLDDKNDIYIYRSIMHLPGSKEMKGVSHWKKKIHFSQWIIIVIISREKKAAMRVVFFFVQKHQFYCQNEASTKCLPSSDPELLVRRASYACKSEKNNSNQITAWMSATPLKCQAPTQRQSGEQNWNGFLVLNQLREYENH